MSEAPDRPEPQPALPEPSPDDPRIVSTEELFRGSKELCIEHDGVHYRLRITRRNRLILQK
jgi:hemin uptake protein HemP